MSLLTDTESLGSSKRIPQLDGLRGLAILFVLSWHYFYFFPDPNHHPDSAFRNLYVYFERCLVLGWSGVDLFFVLSGFLIGGILLDARMSPNYFKTFYFRRFYRIVPVYYAWILFYILLMTFGGPALRSHVPRAAETQGWDHVYAHFLFVQNLGFVRYSIIASVWFVATWSLAVEEQFYLVSPFLIRILSQRALYWSLSTVIFVAPLLRLFMRQLHARTELGLAYILMPCRADALAIGMLAALFWRNEVFRVWIGSRSGVLYGLLGIFSLGVLALGKWSPRYNSLAMQSFGYTWIALFYVLILLLSLVEAGGPIALILRIGWLREFGRVSYCAYIIHYAVNYFCHLLLMSETRPGPHWLIVAVPMLAALLTYALAKVSLIYFEEPLLRRGHAFRY